MGQSSAPLPLPSRSTALQCNAPPHGLCSCQLPPVCPNSLTPQHKHRGSSPSLPYSLPSHAGFRKRVGMVLG